MQHREIEIDDRWIDRVCDGNDRRKQCVLHLLQVPVVVAMIAVSSRNM